MNLRISPIIALLMTGAAIYLGVQWYRADRRADIAEAKIENQRRMAEYASDMQSATFVRATDTMITYRVPQEVTVGGQTYVNAIEKTAGYSPVFTVFGRISGSTPAALNSLSEGRAIRILINSGLVEALYVSP